MQLNSVHSAQDPVAPDRAVQGAGAPWQTPVSRERPSCASGAKSRETQRGAGQDPEMFYHTAVVMTSLVPTERGTSSAARRAAPAQAPAGRRQPAEGWSDVNPQGRTLCPPGYSLKRPQLC